MRILKSTLVVLTFTVASMVSRSAWGSSATIGCTSSATCGGSIGFSGMVSDGSFAVTGDFDVQINSVTGLSSFQASLDDFAPNVEKFDFALENVSVSGGKFIFTDTDGDFTMSGVAELNALPSSNTPTSTSLGFDFFIESVTFGGGDESFGPLTLSEPELGGSITINLSDIPEVTSASGTLELPTINNPNGNGTTPEPGSFLLLGSGLLGLAPLLRRRLSA